MSDKAERYKAAIDRILDLDIGIYPKSFEGQYEKRSDYMNGWNDCALEHAKGISQILRDLGIQKDFPA